MDQGDLTMNNKLDKYKQYVTDKLKHINRLLPKYATGDFSELVPIPESEDEFTKLYTGINQMVEDVQEDNKEKEVNIAELKQVHSQLRDSEKQIKALLNTTSDMAMLIEKDGTVITTNNAMAKAFGQTPDEIINENIFKLMPPDLSKQRKEQSEEAAKLGKVVHFVDQRADHWLDNSLYPIFDAKGKLEQYAIFSHDITELKQTEKALRLSEEKYRTLFQNMNEGFAYHQIVTDKKGKPADFIYLEVNKKFEEITGLKNKMVLNKCATKVIPGIKKAKPDIISLYGEVAQTGKEKSFEIYNEPIEKWLMVRIFSPKKGYFGTMIEDITERKKVEEEMQKLAAVVKHSNELVNLCTLDGKMTFLNEFGGKMLGIEPHEVENVNIMEVIPDNLRGLVEKELLPTMMKEGAWEGDLQYRNMRSGKLTDVHAMTFTIKNPDTGEPQFMANVSLDITERKNTDRELQTLLKKLKEEKNISDSVIESLPGVFYMFNQKGKFVNWNKNFETITEYSKDEVLKSSPLEYFTSETKKKIAAKILTVFTKGEATVEGELLTKSGKRIPHYFTGKRVKINKQYFLLGVGLDISDKKEAEEKLREAMEELKRSNKELEEFAYVASHDLQEPLRMVSSYTQLLEKRYGNKLDKDAKEFIQFAVDGSNRMQGLIQDLLRYSRVTSKGGDFKKVSTNYALGKAITNLRDKIQQSQAVVHNDELPTVMADEMQLMRVFQNLIGNGIKFAGNQSPQINISAEEKNGEWLFSVKDNGIGIEAEYKERIFVIFQRLHGREKYPGTGIGLSICKRIIERHKGKIWVESKPGQGANFYFTLPRIK